MNYRSIGATPVMLAGGLAAGAIVALALTLVASVRHRRRDLALLKALGFTPRQLAAVVAWQATVTAAVGVIVGIPVGIILGRQLWTLFARNIDAVPDPTVPVVSVILVGLGALVFANLVAALPGRIAARTPTAVRAASGVSHEYPLMPRIPKRDVWHKCRSSAFANTNAATERQHVRRPEERGTTLGARAKRSALVTLSGELLVTGQSLLAVSGQIPMAADSLLFAAVISHRWVQPQHTEGRTSLCFVFRFWPFMDRRRGSSSP